jgi:hypothetical protein
VGDAPGDVLRDGLLRDGEAVVTTPPPLHIVKLCTSCPHQAHAGACVKGCACGVSTPATTVEQKIDMLLALVGRLDGHVLQAVDELQKLRREVGVLTARQTVIESVCEANHP